MKSLVLNFAKNEELNNKEIEELRDILNDISKNNRYRVQNIIHI